MEVSHHIRVKWSIRGDYERSASDAWANGVDVRLPNYNYGSARYDSQTETALLSNGEKITTVIRCYPHTEVIPIEKVCCIDCGTEFEQQGACPSCGSDDWE